VARAWTQSLPDGWPASIAGVDAHLGGLGLLWLLGCVPALAWLLWSCRRHAGQEVGGLAPRDRAALVLLAAIVGLAFLATPLRWWARYTCWIYAAGLPPLAWLVQRRLARGPAAGLPGRCWPVALLTILLCETLAGWWLLAQDAARFRRLAPNDGSPLQTRALLAMFPEANGTALERLCTGREAVAFGPLAGQSPISGSFRSALLGPFCLPVGARRIFGVDDLVTGETLAGLARRGVRHLVWSRAHPLPPALRAAAAAVEPAGGFVVVYLPAPQTVSALWPRLHKPEVLQAPHTDKREP
jgi:hypothetical protein